MPEAYNRPQGITPEMIKGVQSIFDGAESPNQDMQDKLANLQQRISEENKEKEKVAVSGGVTTVDALKAMYRRQRTLVKDYKVGRNDPCPCGSGKKYKNCCMNSGKYETTHEI